MRRENRNRTRDGGGIPPLRERLTENPGRQMEGEGRRFETHSHTRPNPAQKKQRFKMRAEQRLAEA